MLPLLLMMVVVAGGRVRMPRCAHVRERQLDWLVGRLDSRSVGRSAG